jgi:hypothetical protein
MASWWWWWWWWSVFHCFRPDVGDIPGRRVVEVCRTWPSKPWLPAANPEPHPAAAKSFAGKGAMLLLVIRGDGS